MINVEKSQPAPECLALEKLKKDGDYGCKDVRLRLKHDFFNKCYICEEKAPSSIVIKQLLSPESAFTAFKIWIIKSRADYMIQFGDLLPSF